MSDTSSQIMTLAAESYRQGAVDALTSFREAIEAAQAGPMWTPDVLALIDVAIDEIHKVNKIDRHPPGEPQPQEAQQEHTE